VGKSSSTQIFVCVVGWFFLSLFFKENLPNGEKIVAHRGKNMYVWYLDTCKLVLFSNDVPVRCLGTTEKTFTDSGIVLQVTAQGFLIPPCSSA